MNDLNAYVGAVFLKAVYYGFPAFVLVFFPGIGLAELALWLVFADPLHSSGTETYSIVLLIFSCTCWFIVMRSLGWDRIVYRQITEMSA